MFSNNFKNEDGSAEAIVHLIIFFDLFDYPLTTYEIWKYLDRKIALVKIEEILDNLCVSGKTVQKDGFFFLPSRAGILLIRRERHNHSRRKLKIARRFAKLFKVCPFVRAVILSNSIGQNNLRDGSDIDFLIITAPRRLWLTRLFCTGLAKLANRRPTDKNKRDKICLSFYLSAENMNLDGYRLVGGDPYLFYWLRSLILLYNRNNTYEQFLIANNIIFGDSVSEDSRPSLKFNSLLDRLERIAAKLQLMIMSPVLKKAINNSDGVVVNNQVLKFYLRDKRREYAEKYGNRIS